MHVTDVLAGDDDRVNVLIHEALGVRDGVGLGKPDTSGKESEGLHGEVDGGNDRLGETVKNEWYDGQESEDNVETSDKLPQDEMQ